ncbi:alpha/beta hydrolase [Rubripirellula amarantea]|nr:alpha/beta hydrolase [Rubripirellula amarantea]
MHRWILVSLAATLSLHARATEPVTADPVEPKPRAAESVAAGASANEPATDLDNGPVNGPVVVHPNVAYVGDYTGDSKANLCDIYLPPGPAPKDGFPVVVVVHGGGWISGDKWTLEGYSRLLARNGIASITINYRLAPTYPFPAQVDDVRSALIWVRSHKDEYHLDLSRLGLFGYSAGGHLSLLVASLADEPSQTQLSASEWAPSDARWGQLPEIACVCVGGPPCDFRSLPLDNTAMAYFLGGSKREKPVAYVAASPIAHVSSNDPPTYIIHGDKDLIVPIEGAKKFHQSQIQADIESHLEVMPGQGHMITFINPKTSQRVVEFFRKRWLAAE